jgi:predicted nucleic acid-binding Zn ribbon protein
MPVFSLDDVQPCVCGVYDFPHIHCGVCGKPIATDKTLHEGVCPDNGFHKENLSLENDWCTCEGNHVEKFVAKNSCVCGCQHSHAHCLGCGKIIDGSVIVK